MTISRRPRLAALLIAPALAGCARPRPATAPDDTLPAVGAPPSLPSPSLPPPSLPPPSPPPLNTGPTSYQLTLAGHVRARSGAAGGPPADSVVLLPDAGACAARLIAPPPLPGRRRQSAPVAANGAFGLTLLVDEPTPCLRIAAVRAGRLGPPATRRPGPLAERYYGAPAAPEDSAQVDLVAP